MVLRLYLSERKSLVLLIHVGFEPTSRPLWQRFYPFELMRDTYFQMLRKLSRISAINYSLIGSLLLSSRKLLYCIAGRTLYSLSQLPKLMVRSGVGTISGLVLSLGYDPRISSLQVRCLIHFGYESIILITFSFCVSLSSLVSSSTHISTLVSSCQAVTRRAKKF